MALLDSARTQRRLVEWQARRGTVHVVVGVSVVSVVISVIIAYPLLILGYGTFAAVGTVGMLLPVVVPAAVARSPPTKWSRSCAARTTSSPNSPRHEND
ncbi:MAG: hypothetical protein ABJH68_04125 [Ilumatobacter sp.]|uniref:hypothetical protein n=1 Tax=Ilumatobacter sp. TaxID=1967498 RepID=UPI00329A50D8